MKLKLQRFSGDTDSTLGLFYIDDKFSCYTLEDEYREDKVYGETRIPAGTYPVKLRTEGTTHEAYSKRFPSFHIGTLHITDIPDYKYVLIHIGNTDEDTAGCLLVGDSVNNNTIEAGRLKYSTQAYIRIYKEISKALFDGENVEIEVLDEV